MARRGGRTGLGFSAAQVLPSLSMILAPQHYLHRVVEAAAPRRHRITRRLSYDMTVPQVEQQGARGVEARTDRPVLVPILFVEKGHFFDDLSIHVDGQAVSVLTRHQHRLYTEYLIAQLVATFVLSPDANFAPFVPYIDELAEAIAGPRDEARQAVRDFFDGPDTEEELSEARRWR